MIHQKSMINGKFSDFSMASGTIDLTKIVQHISHSSNSVRGKFLMFKILLMRADFAMRNC